MNFVQSFKSEWLKKKRSAASWLMISGSFLIPTIILIARIVNFDDLYSANLSKKLWETLATQSWQFMAFFLLPMGIVLATSLITQLEFKNNTWKQLHTTPQRLSIIFFSKLSVIVVMMMQFFILFNLSIYLAGVIPSILFRGIPYPQESIPFVFLFKINAKFFIACLPIIALQYLISLQFKNFLIPIGFGLGMFVASMIALSWKCGYVVPYTYCALTFMGRNSSVDPNVNIYMIAGAYFLLLTIASYILYITKKEKG